MTIWGRIQGYCGHCGATRDWFVKDDGVVCAGCGIRRKILTPPQGVIEAYCGHCGADRDWIVSADGDYVCLGCGITRS